MSRGGCEYDAVVVGSGLAVTQLVCAGCHPPFRMKRFHLFSAAGTSWLYVVVRFNYVWVPAMRVTSCCAQAAETGSGKTGVRGL